MNGFAEYRAWSGQAGEQAAEQIEFRHGHGALRIARAARRLRQCALELIAALVQAALEAFRVDLAQRREQHFGHLERGAGGDKVRVQARSPFADWWSARLGDGESGASGNGGSQ